MKTKYRYFILREVSVFFVICQALSENTIQLCFQCSILCERQCITLAQMVFLNQLTALKSENEVQGDLIDDLSRCKPVYLMLKDVVTAVSRQGTPVSYHRC